MLCTLLQYFFSTFLYQFHTYLYILYIYIKLFVENVSAHHHKCIWVVQFVVACRHIFNKSSEMYARVVQKSGEKVRKYGTDIVLNKHAEKIT